MTYIVMKPQETIQTFLNRFKTVVADLSWNNATVVATLHTKLTNKIAETIHLLCPQSWPKTFTELKKVAQEADNYLCIRKWTQEDLLPDWDEPTKKVHFEWPFAKCTDPRTTSPYHEKLATIGSPNSIPVSAEDKVRKAEMWHRREHSLCINCGGSGHWADTCSKPKNS